MSGEQQFADLKGETLVKPPGSIAGESFALRNLEGCSVFILDFTSEVEVTNCANCQLFIGPVDGPAIFSDCTNCQVAVACQQFQAKGCSGVEFGLFCATQPSISACSGIRISCWAGAYPGLTQHFAAANLDPKSNHWSKVYDASEEDGSAANYEVVTEPASWWEVPLEGAGTPDNPVPSPDGTIYAYSGPAIDGFNDAEAAGLAAEAAAPPANGVAAPASAAISDDFLAEGGVQLGGESAAGETIEANSGTVGGEHPALVAAREALHARLAEQARAEAEKKATLQQQASSFLQAFYEKRSTAKDERIRAGRDALSKDGGSGGDEHGPVGDTPWERTVSLINFNLAKPAGTDLSRFKSVLFSLKAKDSAPAGAP